MKIILIASLVIGLSFSLSLVLFDIADSVPYIGVAIASFLTNWIVSLVYLFIARYVTIELPVSYYRLHQFELNKRTYERLGIRIVQPIIQRLGLIKYSGSRKDLTDLLKQMRGAEINHIYTFITIQVLTLFCALDSKWNAVIWLTLFNILFNVYPTILQRYNRVKLEPIMARYKKPR